MGQLEKIVGDALLARSGDTDATVRLARNGVPLLARSMGIPGPLIDIAAALYDNIARPELQVADRYEVGYATPGFKRFIAWLRNLTDGVVVTIGATGQGKTATMCAIAHNWPRASHRYIVGVDPDILKDTPLEPFEWNAGRIRRLPYNSVLIVPDSGLYLDSRDFGKDTETAVRELATIARHRQIRFLIDAQYSSLLSKSAFLCRALLYKYMGPGWEVIERDELRKLARPSQQAFAEMPRDERMRYVWAHCPEADFQGTVPVRLPEWWSDDLSASHAYGDVIEGDYTVVDR